VLPLATLLGLGELPGEGYGLGPLDPGLCRELGAAAIGSPWSRLCVTVTDADGIAIGHGCARPARRAARYNGSPGVTGLGSPSDQSGPGVPGLRSRFDQSGQGQADCAMALALPARVQLTITAGLLAELDGATGPPGTPGTQGTPGQPSLPGRSPWSLIRADDLGPPGGFGNWALALPDGRRLAVGLEPVPTFDCDHRHESRAYQPNDMLRHMVQVRDGECTFPPCSRHARETDFEHAVPFDKGGRTCGCNAGARSRACHRVKQSAGWNVTQPRPGWHQWTTPEGRTYTQGPKRYPV
jgi:hypothetical protein